MKGRKTTESPGTESPVPEAMARLLALLDDRLGAASMDRLWLFPPLVRGRKEWGLVVVSCLSGVKDQRTVITARYAAELTGTGVEFQPDLASEGVAPPERLPVVMDGVVRRSDLPLGTAREVKIAGDPDVFRDLLREHGGEPGPDGSDRDRDQGTGAGGDSGDSRQGPEPAGNGPAPEGRTLSEDEA